MTARAKTKCGTGKVAFQSRGEANRALSRIALTEQQAAVHIDTVPCRAYRCRCGKWHLTSQEQRTERQPRKPRAPRKPRRSRRPAKPKTARHLTLAPAVPVAKAPAEPAPVFAPSDPITGARRALWAANEAERRRLEAEYRNTWRREAA